MKPSDAGAKKDPEFLKPISTSVSKVINFDKMTITRHPHCNKQIIHLFSSDHIGAYDDLRQQWPAHANQ